MPRCFGWSAATAAPSGSRLDVGSILRDNPVFLREARWWYRLHWLRRSKSAAWTAAMIAAIFVWFYVRGLWAVWQGDAAQFRPVWFWLIRFLLILIVLLGPALASTAIMKEREQRTWETLALTRLTAREIFLGKWLASLTPLCLLILATTPLLMVAYATFGTSFSGMLAVLVFFPVTAAAYTMLGLLCSFLAQKASVARMSALTAAIGLCFGLLIVDGLFRQLLVPEMSGYGSWQILSLYSNYRSGYGYDYGYFGFPSVTWFSPFFVLSVLSGWAESRETLGGYPAYSFDEKDVWSREPSSVLLVYSLSLIVAIGVCLYYMLTRYRRDVRGGRPLGEPIT